MPIDFWPRVISRFLNFSEFGSPIGYDIWNGLDIEARREGIKLMWDDGTKVVVQSRKNDYIIDMLSPKQLENETWCGSDCPDHLVKV